MAAIFMAISLAENDFSLSHTHTHTHSRFNQITFLFAHKRITQQAHNLLMQFGCHFVCVLNTQTHTHTNTYFSICVCVCICSSIVILFSLA